jgi:hypothetical protein
LNSKKKRNKKSEHAQQGQWPISNQQSENNCRRAKRRKELRGSFLRVLEMCQCARALAEYPPL